ncbi:MAG: FAD-dependent thymidylate synthase [bacterium]|nr:FAD-dependent thymidylate synthase [bacterium]
MHAPRPAIDTDISVLDHGYVRYVAHLGDDLTPLEAARMSTGNPTGVDSAKDAATRDYLWRHAHATPFEMSVLQIEVQCPIFVAREWMRHRTQSFNEFSGRYAEMPALQYVPAPERVQAQSGTNKQGSGVDLDEAARETFLASIAEDQHAVRAHYEEYLQAGVARELARINLPLAQYTRFRAQANLRNWLHFLDLRLAPNAQYEIRVYAGAVAQIIQQLWPLTWNTFEEHTLCGARLSRNELALLRTWLTDAFGGPDGSSLEESLTAMTADRLPPSRLRELLAKLGLRGS